jgi:predicted transcriptional regulator
MVNIIGNQLITARTRRGIDQENLALLTGLNVYDIAAIEAGTVDVQVSTLHKLSEALKWSFSIGDVSI